MNTIPSTPHCRPNARKKAWEMAKREGVPVYLHWDGNEYVIRTSPLPASQVHGFTAECTVVLPHGETQSYTPR